MGIIGDALATLVPPVGTAGPGYATTINALLEEFKTRLVAKIGFASLNAGAVPASTAALTVSSAGALSTNSSGNRVGTVFATNADVTNPIKHGPKFRQYPAQFLATITGAPINFTNGRGVGSASGACSFYAQFPPMERGERILSVTGNFSCGVGVGTSAITVRRRNRDGLAPTSLGTQSSGATGADVAVAVSGLTETVGTGAAYVLEVATGRSQDALESITVEYDRP